MAICDLDRLAGFTSLQDDAVQLNHVCTEVGSCSHGAFVETVAGDFAMTGLNCLDRPVAHYPRYSSHLNPRYTLETSAMSAASPTDYYQTLGVQRAASDADIKKA